MSTPAKQLVLDSAESFFLALRSPDLATSLGVFRAVANNPEAALAFGSHNGRDIVDELIWQSKQREGASFMEVIFGTLAAFDDPRVVERFAKVIHTSPNPVIVKLAAARLSHEPIESVEATIRPLLLQENSTLHSGVAADLMLASSNLTLRERVRVSVANSQGVDVGPELSVETLPDWLDELSGWFAPQARTLLVARDEEVVLRELSAVWTDLDAETKGWLVSLARPDNLLEVVEVLRRALQDANTAVVLSALAAIDGLAEGKGLFASAMTPLLEHSERNVRVLALRAGARSNDWRALLEREKEPEVIMGLAKRLAEAEGAKAFDVLEPLLTSPDYRIRAAGTEAFKTVGSSAIPLLRERTGSDDLAVKVAATQALVALDDYAWLEENLLLQEDFSATIS